MVGGPAVLSVAPDVAPPSIVGVAADCEAGKITVIFDECVGPSALEPFNYGLVPGSATATAVTRGADDRTVCLSVETLEAGATYTLQVSGVLDECFNEIAEGTSVLVSCPGCDPPELSIR